MSKYPNCIDCGKSKVTYSQRLSPRCYTCAGKYKRKADYCYLECVDCREPKTGVQQIYERCRPCAYAHLKKNEIFDTCQECGEPKKHTKYRCCQSCASKQCWTDSSYKERMSAILSEIWSDPERREKQRQRGIAQWQDSEVREHNLKGLQAAWNDNRKRKQAQGERIKQQWKEPDFRKEQTTRIKKMAQTRESSGPDNPNWRGGKSFEPYSHTFNKDLKQMVRERDGEKCRLCSETENLQVHHVDYDKMNDDAENLVTLCAHHHGKTNSARQFWQVVFTRYMGRAPSRYPAVRGIV